MKDIRVAIVGAGIGGLACAVALKGKGFDVHIYEANSEISEIGAGLTLWQRTWEILQTMGLEAELLSILDDNSVGRDTTKYSFHCRKSDVQDGTPMVDLVIPGRNFTVHRGHLQKVLLENIPSSCQVHLGHRLMFFKETEDAVELTFQNGDTVTCDLLVAADGVNSVVRQQMFHAPAFYTGTKAYRGLIPTEILESSAPNHRTTRSGVIYCGKNKHLVVYPIAQGTLVNVVAFHSEPSDEHRALCGPSIRNVPVAEILDKYEGWDEEVQVLLKNIKNPIEWAILAVDPLSSYVSSRVALVGDAAHAMTPHLGAGAGQAIEDGFCLGVVLSGQTANSTAVPVLLQQYNRIRQPYGNKILMGARKQGFWLEFNVPDSGGRDASKEEAIVEITKGWEWAGTSALSGEKPE